MKRKTYEKIAKTEEYDYILLDTVRRIFVSGVEAGRKGRSREAIVENANEVWESWLEAEAREKLGLS